MSLILSGTDGLSDVDGSAATPAIRGTDANTGIFFPAADTIAFAEGGAEVARFDSSGNLGVGTSSPGGKLSVVGASSATLGSLAQFTIPGGQGFYLNSNSTGTLNTLAVGTGENLAFNTGASERMRINSSGDVGIGTSSPLTKLQIKTQANGNAGFQNSTSVAGGVKINCFNDAGSASAPFEIDGSTLQFNIASAEKMRLDSSGQFSIGKTSPGEGAQTGSGYGFASPSSDPYFTIVNANASGGNACIYLNRRTTGTLIAFGTNAGSGFSVVGSISHNGSNTAYNTSSDYRLKDSVAPMTGALAKVAQLKPCTYTWKSTGANGQGFIAHELQEVFPDAVEGEKDALDKNGDIAPQGIDTSFLVATLTAAIQEQQALIQSLTDRITALETPAVTPPVNEQPA